MRWGHPSQEKVVLLLGDIVCVLVGVFLGASVRFGVPINIFDVHRGVAFVFALGFLSLAYVFDLYSLDVLADRTKMLLRLSFACLATMAVASTYLYFMPPAYYGRSIIILTVLIAGVGALGWRLLFARHRTLFVSREPVVILGSGEKVEAVQRLLASANSRYVLAACVPTEEKEAWASTGERPGGASAALMEVVTKNGTRGIILCSDSIPVELARTITGLKFRGVAVYPAADFYMRIAEELPIEFLTHSWLWFAEGFSLIQAQLARRIKRLADLFLASLGLALTFPISVLVAIAIKLDSPGPIIYRQTRIGCLEQPFQLLKFRSMFVNAEHGGRPQWADLHDPRVTLVGKLMRKLHIDEIPQMINVLKGEMSFIGPRPERPEFVKMLNEAIPFYHLRHYVPPGITGWAQVMYPYGASIEDAKRKLQFDLYYILHASPLLDLRILLRTARVIFFRTGSR
jgi:sugar transferase (PEP-CTERM system associated)